jgi:hypothetical protein
MFQTIPSNPEFARVIPAVSVRIVISSGVRLTVNS